ARHADQTLGLVLVEAGGPNDLLDVARVGRGKRLRSRIASEQLWRHQIDARVGGLRRQDRRHEQFERIGVIELAQRARILLRESARAFACASFWCSRSSHAVRLRTASTCASTTSLASMAWTIVSTRLTPQQTMAVPRLLTDAAAVDGYRPASDQ